MGDFHPFGRVFYPQSSRFLTPHYPDTDPLLLPIRAP